MREFLGKYKRWLIGLAFLVVCGLGYWWLEYGLIKIDVAQVDTGTLTNQHKDGGVQQLAPNEIQDVVSVINAKKEEITSYGIDARDAWFSVALKMKSGRTANYDIVLKPNGEVYVMKMNTTQGYGSSEKAWVLKPKESPRVYNMPIFKAVFSSSEPLFPIIYAEGQQLLGTQSMETWQYKDLEQTWHTVDFEPKAQAQAYVLNGNCLNVLIPCNPKEKLYAIYGEAGALIEKGPVKGPQLTLPKQPGKYRVELTVTWENDGPVAIQDNSRDVIPSRYKGVTKAVLEVSSGNKPSAIEKPMPITEQLVLIPVEKGLKQLGVAYQWDNANGTLTLETSKVKSTCDLQLETVGADKAKAVKPISLMINQVAHKRTAYVINGVLYMEAANLANDLGLLIQNKFEDTYTFYENQNMYSVLEGTVLKSGYVNLSGEWVIPPVCQFTSDFEEGYSEFAIIDTSAVVTGEDIQGKISGAQFNQFSKDLQQFLIDFNSPTLNGMVDQKGQVIIPPLYRDLSYDGGDLALVKKEDVYGEIALYDLKAKREVVLKDVGNILEVGVPHEGLIPVSVREGDNQNDYYRYIDTQGKTVITGNFETADSFFHQRAVVGSYKSEGDTTTVYGVIDPKGNFKVPFIFDSIERYAENTACVSLITNGVRQYGYIDTEGNLLTDLDYAYAYSFNSGRALVNCNDCQFVYMDKQFNIVKDLAGKVIVAATQNKDIPFDTLNTLDYSMFSFSEGYAPVLYQDQYVYIDRMGNVLTETGFDEAEAFKDGMAKVAIKDEMGNAQETYVDTLGHVLEIKPFEVEK